MDKNRSGWKKNHHLRFLWILSPKETMCEKHLQAPYIAKCVAGANDKARTVVAATAQHSLWINNDPLQKKIAGPAQCPAGESPE